MTHRRFLPRFSLGLLAVLAGLVSTTSAQNQATTKPFLWRVEGRVPSYLYGTIHVPDARVLALPDVVQRAFDAADVFNAELPIDSTTEQRAMALVLLPPDRNLRQVLGDELFLRFSQAIPKLMPPGMPPTLSAGIMPMLQRMKPWAAMDQAGQLVFLRDMLAGRQPLDATLYAMAEKSGKAVGGLETVEEQIAVFDSLTMDEQVRMVADSLDDLDTTGVQPVQELIDLYLAGDLDRLATELDKQNAKGDVAINKKLTKALVDDRNLRMADRIAALLKGSPSRSYFIAVGTAHYAGETGLITQLTKKGFKITRLTPADAATIVRRPAA